MKGSHEGKDRSNEGRGKEEKENTKSTAAVGTVETVTRASNQEKTKKKELRPKR